jgi:hypothetical protein
MMQHANLDDNQIISLTRNVMHAIITCIRIKKQSRTKRWPSGVGGFFFFLVSWWGQPADNIENNEI